MPKFSKFFRISKSQSELDFVDIDTSKDSRYFIDPYAISVRTDDLSEDLKYYVSTFFECVLEAVRKGDKHRAIALTANLTEPQETFLGMSSANPRGRGVGRWQADQILAALRKSRAFKTGLLKDLSEMELFIEGIGPDKISDLTTNLIRRPLIAYTNEQCALHGIKQLGRVAASACWHPEAQSWVSDYHQLPIVKNKPVILVPKVIVRRRLSLDSQEYYNGSIINFLQAEHLSANSGLVRLLRDGKTRKVYKKDVKAEHPFSKDFIADISKNHPKILETYKKLKGAVGALSARDFEENFSETAFAPELARRLKEIPTGRDSANAYHDLVLGILTFLFFPNLTKPVKEMAIDDGRKKIDIQFTNWSTSGFFESIKNSPIFRARYVPIECKNYSDDLANPEFDQLAGRFSPIRGKVGIICCRKIEDRSLAIRRCQDTCKADRGVLLLLDDNDLINLLGFVEKNSRSAIDNYLERLFQEVTH